MGCRFRGGGGVILPIIFGLTVYPVAAFAPPIPPKSKDGSKPPAEVVPLVAQHRWWIHFNW